ncbi:Peptidoglycan/xylan/chitin deacetylase, PgdA/CDA1 family [Clostridium frigidicarnis]|uniref:Peptidoglycan/xylan/chitin deacetylase, PgdA/CDA1 family n=2 Tax=Clostridium frigidicarnis TaxID=84698 RepID=A0A1I0Y0Z3_9CLOT|nr:Peptidoglycan/xylan/chitin deacetylase, PgdA/CDA1 family [Clostridium frigidicarnis]
MDMNYNCKTIKLNKNIIFIIICILVLYSFGFLLGYLYIEYKFIDKNSQNITSSKNEQLSDDSVLDLKENTNKDNNKVLCEDAYKKDGEKVAYITFDDGPSKKITPKILDILKERKIKATFFVLGQNIEENKEILKREYDEGHSIGNHSYSHEFGTIYNNLDAFKKEVEKTNMILEKTLGDDFKTRLFRFPGGSFENYKNKFKDYIKENNMIYIDWNALTGDAEGQNVSKEKLLDHLVKDVEGKEKIVILMHDAATKETTLEALPSVLDYLKNNGYIFKILK